MIFITKPRFHLNIAIKNEPTRIKFYTCTRLLQGGSIHEFTNHIFGSHEFTNDRGKTGLCLFTNQKSRIHRNSRIHEKVFQFSRIREQYFVFSRITKEIVFTNSRTIFFIFTNSRTKKANSRLPEHRWGASYSHVKTT